MNPRQRTFAIMGGVLALAALALWMVQRRADVRAATPAWLVPAQPPEGVAIAPAACAAKESWAAARPPHMTACCADRTARARVRRTYAPTLADDGDALAMRFELGGEFNAN